MAKNKLTKGESKYEEAKRCKKLGKEAEVNREIKRKKRNNNENPQNVTQNIEV